MWSVWLVFCDCGFNSVCPLMDKDKRLKEVSWWERLTEGETGSCSGGWGYAQFSSVEFSSVKFSSVAPSCPTLWDPMDCSKPGFPVHHQLLAFTQTHVHRVDDAIQTSHPLSSPSPPTFHLSQHQRLFQWVSSLHYVVKVLEFQLQHQSPTKRSLEIPEKGKAEISSFQ